MYIFLNNFRIIRIMYRRLFSPSERCNDFSSRLRVFVTRLNRIHICKSLVEFHATRKQDYNIMVRSRCTKTGCAYDVQRETNVIRLRSYCLPLYLVGNHFERYYASSSRHFVPQISPTSYSNRSFQRILSIHSSHFLFLGY